MNYTRKRNAGAGKWHSRPLPEKHEIFYTFTLYMPGSKTQEMAASIRNVGRTEAQGGVSSPGFRAEKYKQYVPTRFSVFGLRKRQKSVLDYNRIF